MCWLEFSTADAPTQGTCHPVCGGGVFAALRQLNQLKHRLAWLSAIVRCNYKLGRHGTVLVPCGWKSPVNQPHPAPGVVFFCCHVVENLQFLRFALPPDGRLCYKFTALLSTF
jgi:hypothetical protein